MSAARWPAVAGVLAGVAWALDIAALVVAAVSGTVGRVSWPDFAIGLAYPAVVVVVSRVRAAAGWSALMLMSGLASAANVAASTWADRWAAPCEEEPPMTAQTAATQTAVTPPVAIRARSLWVGTATTVLAIAAVLWSVLKSGTSDKSQVDSLPYVAAVAVIVGGALFVWLVPARAAKHSTGLVFAIVSVPLLWAFWSALPMLVAVAALLLAVTHRSSGGPHRGRALATIIIGVPVTLLTLVGVLLG